MELELDGGVVINGCGGRERERGAKFKFRFGFLVGRVNRKIKGIFLVIFSKLL